MVGIRFDILLCNPYFIGLERYSYVTIALMQYQLLGLDYSLHITHYMLFCPEGLYFIGLLLKVLYVKGLVLIMLVLDLNSCWALYLGSHIAIGHISNKYAK